MAHQISVLKVVVVELWTEKRAHKWSGVECDADE
jgi:hypothetical protein